MQKIFTAPGLSQSKSGPENPSRLDLDGVPDLPLQQTSNLEWMTAGIVHEIANPLAIIHGTASELYEVASACQSIRSQPVQSASLTILETCERMLQILNGLRNLALKARGESRRPASLAGIVAQVSRLQRQRFANEKVSLETLIPDDLPLLLCREAQIGQILTNLLNNAVDALAQQDGVERWVRVNASAPGKYVHVDVSDSGKPIGSHVRERMMEAFFTTREDGLGIGLSLSLAIAREHGGDLVLLDTGETTCFRLTLPIAGADARGPDAA